MVSFAFVCLLTIYFITVFRKELDTDSDGTITYSEFIYTFVKWVASTSSEEEDEEMK